MDIEHCVQMAGHPLSVQPSHRVNFVLHEQLSVLVQLVVE